MTEPRTLREKLLCEESFNAGVAYGIELAGRFQAIASGLQPADEPTLPPKPAGLLSEPPKQVSAGIG